MPKLLDDPAGIRELLEKAHRIAVIGASVRPERASHRIMSYLLQAGYEVMPVNPSYGSVLGQKCFTSLSEIADPVDIVNVFRRPDRVDPIVTEAIERGDGALWLQDGVVVPEAADRALEAGLVVVMDRCIFRDHARMTRNSP